MEAGDLDYVLVPCGLLVMAVYHFWLLYRIARRPRSTVIGLNAINRQLWVHTMVSDPLKNGVLAVQTIRNNIMASTLLASTAITLSSIIGVLVRTGSDSSSPLVVGNRTPTAISVKYFTLLLCFLLAFLFNVQSIRYYGHVSFLISTCPVQGGEAGPEPEYVGRALNRGSYFWSMGLRAFYLSFPLTLWTFGPIPMVGCCCVLVCLLFFLDSTTDYFHCLFCFRKQERAAPSLPASHV